MILICLFEKSGKRLMPPAYNPNFTVSLLISPTKISSFARNASIIRNLTSHNIFLFDLARRHFHTLIG